MADDGNCTLCGRPLTRSKWNTDTDILFCNNVSCKEWHSPIVPPEAVGKFKPTPKSTLPPWYGEHTNPTMARIYKLRLELEVSELDKE